VKLQTFLPVLIRLDYVQKISRNTESLVQELRQNITRRLFHKPQESAGQQVTAGAVQI
jgi:hypothetical protein